MTDIKAEIKRQCAYCGSKEGKSRPVGNYIVELKEINYKNGPELACQTCYMIRKKNSE
jgi:hypothetical protein